MAARRLVLVLIVLFMVSTFAATLVPPPEDDGEQDTTEPGSTATATRTSKGIAEHEFDADAKRPQRFRITQGDAVELTVTSKRAGEVEIPELGEFDEVDQFAPAVFDLLPSFAGRYEVRWVEDDSLIGKIVVASPRADDKGRDPEAR